MSNSKRQMHLAVFVVGTGNHSAGWRYEGAFDSNCAWQALESIAKTAERGKFDLFFVSDGLTADADDQPSFVTRFEPTTLLGAISLVTRTSDSARPSRRVSASRFTLRACSPRSIT
jgi:hypothetical protein